jgi:hypothetical protein
MLSKKKPTTPAPPAAAVAKREREWAGGLWVHAALSSQQERNKRERNDRYD